MLRQARIDLLEIGLRRRRHERQTRIAQRLDGAVDVARAAGDVLDALAAIDVEIFLDLPGIAGILVDRNPDLAVRAGQRAGEQAGRAAFDVEEADLAEVEQFFVEAGPHIHPAAMDVVGEVIDVIEPGARGPRVLCAQPFELGVIGRALGAVAIDEIQQAAADALDGGNVERLLRGSHIGRLRAERERTLVGLLRIDHAERHRRRAGAMRGNEAMAMGAGLLVDEIIDIALAIDGDLLGPVAGDRRVAHQPEQRVQFFGIRVRIFDELETVGAHRIVGADGGGRRVVRKRTHGENSRKLIWINIGRIRRKVHANRPALGYNDARFVHRNGILRMIPVDAFDLKMLAALQDDGRLTNQQLADLVGLSASQCSRRRMRLEEEKVIAGYHADLSGEALGFNLIAFIQVTLATHSPDNSKKFRALVNRVDDIQEAYSLTGDADYVLKVVLRDLKDLSGLVNDVLMPHQSVAHVRSSIVLDRLKESARLPLKDASMAQFEGNSSFAFRGSICDDGPEISITRDDHGAATPAELRILRQGPAAERGGRADLFLRMHVLRGLRGEQAAQCLPELRRRV